MEGGTSPPYPPNYGLLSQKVENLGSNLHLACSHQVVESPEAPCPPPLPPEVSSWRNKGAFSWSVVEVVDVEVFGGGQQVISISSKLYLEGGAGIWWEEELGVVAVERKKVETNTIKMVTMAMA